jgi:hypothetical protein
LNLKYFLNLKILKARELEQKRLDKTEVKQIENMYKKGVKLGEIESKFGVTKKTIAYHRKKALSEVGDDWLAIRNYNNNIVKNSADDQDEHAEKILEISESLIKQLEEDLEKKTKTIVIKTELGANTQEVDFTPDDYLKLTSILEKIFNLKNKYITTRIRGDKETLIVGAKIFAELQVIFIKNHLKEKEALTADELSEMLPEILKEVERKIGK